MADPKVFNDYPPQTSGPTSDAPVDTADPYKNHIYTYRGDVVTLRAVESGDSSIPGFHRPAIVTPGYNPDIPAGQPGYDKSAYDRHVAAERAASEAPRVVITYANGIWLSDHDLQSR